MYRPRALVVEPDRLRQRRRAVLLRAAGFSVVSTRRVPAAMAYCNLVSPEIVVASPSAARLLMGCYPDGPFWIRALREDDVTVLPAAGRPTHRGVRHRGAALRGSSLERRPVHADDVYMHNPRGG